MNYKGKCVMLLRQYEIIYNTVSEKALTDIVSEKLDYKVLAEVIENNKETFEKFKDQPSGYKFGILKNKVFSDYFYIKHQIYNTEEDNIINLIREEFGCLYNDIDRDFVVEAFINEAERRRGY